MMVNKRDKKKLQHTVPKLYLRAWVVRGKQVFVFDKITKLRFPQSVEQATGEVYFYNLPSDGGTDAAQIERVEDTLARIEHWFEPALTGVLSALDRREEITSEQKHLLAEYLPIQIYRTRKFRNELNAYRERVENLRRRILTRARFGEKMLRYVPIAKVGKDEEALPHAMFILDPNLRAASVRFFFEDHAWVIGINETEHPLYTSDNPVLAHNINRYPSLTFAGLTAIGSELVWPLSPRYLLVLCHKDTGQPNGYVVLTPANVEYYNSLQVLQSHRQVICSADDFDLAEGICKEE